MSEEKDRAKLGLLLKEAREYRGFSQEDVAKVLGLPRPAISLIENGVRGLDVLELKKLAKFYKCPIEELTGEVPDKASEPETIRMVARTAAALSQDDRNEVLRFAQFLQAKKPGKKE